MSALALPFTLPWGGVGACRGRRRGCHRRHQRRRGRPGVGLVAFHGPGHVEEEGQRKRERERSEGFGRRRR
jgi:hypothetical protein